MDLANLLLSTVFGSIGVGYFLYGKKQGKALHIITGFALMGGPYLISNALPMICLGLILVLIPVYAS